MNKIIRIWNQNRKQIIIITLAVVLFFLLIQILNQIAKNKIENIDTNKVNRETQDLPTQSIITGETVKEETTKTNVQIIENFVERCNSQDIDSAYDLLTDECKETLFDTKEKFINNYYNIIFTEPRTINIDNYKNASKTNTYKVTFYGDVLGTGDISGTDKYQDYITVNQDSGKLSINSLINSKKMDSYKEENGITVTILKQEIYKDYEIYQIKVQNNTSNKILLDTRKNQKTVYATGSNNVKYTAFTNEIISDLYEISEYGVETYNLKFNKLYEPSIRTKKITFSDIVNNYEKYTQENTNERLKIEVQL